MKHIFLLLVLVGFVLTVNAQSVGIGTATPDASAALEVSSVTQGMLVPRMSTAQREMIVNPVQGLLVFDITSNSFWFRNSSSWVELVDDVNTEVHRNGPDKIYMAMNDSVGIGLSTPTNKLDIQSGSPRTGTHATGRPLYVTGDLGDASDGIEFMHNNGTQGIGFGFNTIYAAGGNASQNLGMSAKGPLGALVFNTSGAERFRISESGNVGIGTASPHAPLQLSNTVANRKLVLYELGNNDHQFIGLGVNPNILRYQVSSVSTDHIFYAATSATSSNELLRIRGNGRVGIGSTDPQASLDVSRGSGEDGTARFQGTTYHSQFNYSTTENTFIRGGKTGSNLLLNDLAGLGNVGIGTGAPLHKLHVAGSVFVEDRLGIGIANIGYPLSFASNFGDKISLSGSSGNHFGFGIGSSLLQIYTDLASSDIGFGYGSSSAFTERMRIMGNGNVGIGTPSPDQLFSVANKVGISDDGSIRFKNDVSNMMYMYTGASSAPKMVIAHSTSYPDWGLQYDGSMNAFKFLADSIQLMDVNLGSNFVEINGTLKIGYTRIESALAQVIELGTASIFCDCPTGTVVVGGGHQTSQSGIDIISSYPNTDTTWFVKVHNNNIVPITFKAYAICARFAK